MLGPGRWEGRVSRSVSSGLWGSVNLVTCLNEEGAGCVPGRAQAAENEANAPPRKRVLSSPEVSSNTSAFYESGLAVTTMNLVP